MASQASHKAIAFLHKQFLPALLCFCKFFSEHAVFANILRTGNHEFLIRNHIACRVWISTTW